ncbi:hypothetical protein D3C81_1193840 [compost metagenome]
MPASSAAVSSASNACAGFLTGSPARSASTPSRSWWRTCRAGASKPLLPYCTLPRTLSNCRSQRLSASRAPRRSTVPCRRPAPSPRCSGSSRSKSTPAGPATLRLSSVSPYVACNGLCFSIASRWLPSSTVVARTCSCDSWKSAMPACIRSTFTPASSPLPCSSKPLAMNLMSASTCRITGQSLWKRMLPSSIRPPASKRPSWSLKGQSSRSPTARPVAPRRVPSTSAASSQSTAA